MLDEKKEVETNEVLVKVFDEIIEPYIGGNPQDTTQIWTSLKPKEIQAKLIEKGHEVSYYIANQLIRFRELKRRSYLKTVTIGPSNPFRNDQFKKISNLKEYFFAQNLPVFSIDTKKKELLGNFHRLGHYYDKVTRHVNDHDFESHADGKIVPHGIYDLAQNKGYMTLGISKDTSAFVCDNIAHFWKSDLQWIYLNAEWMLIFCDGGGSNNARHYIVKQDFCKLAKHLKMNIVIAHYPPYCSKYNPIEHRLFAHVHHAWDGAIFSNIHTVKELTSNTSTKTGLEVITRINQNKYMTKRPVNEVFKENINDFVLFDENLPQWNYVIKHQNVDLIF